MPKKLRYLAGIRGAPDVKFRAIYKELDLG